jgi:hypothetical protein
MEWGAVLVGSYSSWAHGTVLLSRATRLLVARRVPEISQHHDMQTSFNVSHPPPPLLNLSGANSLFVFSNVAILMCGELLAPDSLRAE